MPVTILLYLLKFSISLSLVFLFYRLFLQRLTFYQWNRWYLLGYSLLSLIIPLLNITPVLESNRWGSTPFLNRIPAMGTWVNGQEWHSGSQAGAMSSWDLVLAFLVLGVLLLLIRLGMQYLSLYRLRSQATLLIDDRIRVYQVNRPMMPFSFGNSIYINPAQHSKNDLQEIIRHEFIHVKQRHSIDILWSEALCILNWYNPLAWGLRKAIRQNLEFIADEQVLANGVDRKQYQFLLLKVMGTSTYSIAQPFNLYSLKKRIAMMNKIRSARVHLLRFLFFLPVIALLLLSFRRQWNSSPATFRGTGINGESTIPAPSQQIGQPGQHAVIEPNQKIDTLPPRGLARYGRTPNEKGYIVTVVRDAGEYVVIVRDSHRRIVRAIPKDKWDSDSSLEELYGPILYPPPPPPAPPAPAAPEAAPAPPRLPDNVKRINVENHRARVYLKNGKTEIYNLDKPDEKASFEKKYGPPVLPPLPPVAPVPEEDGAVTVSAGTIALAPGTNLTIASPDQAGIPAPAVLGITNSSGNADAVTAAGLTEIGESSDQLKVDPALVAVQGTTVIGGRLHPVPSPGTDLFDQDTLRHFEGLIVVDGKPLDGKTEKLDDIDPGRIRSIRILKGGADTIRKYGQAGRQGVIEIELKKD